MIAASPAAVRHELGKSLAAISTLLRAEYQGVADLGPEAAERLAELYIPGLNELRPGYARGRKVWDAYAVHAFNIWGHRHPEEWPSVFRGFLENEAFTEEILGEASRQNDPVAWRAAYEDRGDSEGGGREHQFLAHWAWHVLQDREAALYQLNRIQSLNDLYLCILAADLQWRLGFSPEQIRLTLAGAEAFDKRPNDWLSLADAWLGNLGDTAQAAYCLRQGGYDWNQVFGDEIVAHSCLALLIQNRPIVEAALRNQAEEPPTLSARLNRAQSALFFTDEESVVRRRLDAITGKRLHGFDAYLVGKAWVDIFDAREKAAFVLRGCTSGFRSREELYELAWNWLIETGDHSGARELLIAAKPHDGSCRPPWHYLEWAKEVLSILGDRDLAVEGILEAEQRARHDWFHAGMNWDSIVTAWMKINRPDEARRVLIEATATLTNADLGLLAKDWQEFFGDEPRARACLEKGYANLSETKVFRLRDLLFYARIYLDLWNDHKHAEPLFREAEALAETDQDRKEIFAARHRIDGWLRFS